MIGTFRDALEAKYGKDSSVLENKFKDIDNIIRQELSDNLVFTSGSLLINENGIRTENLQFFPIDNKKGRNSDVAKRLLGDVPRGEKGVIDSYFDDSEYVCGNPKPVSWLKSYDQLKQLQKSQIPYDEVANICKERDLRPIFDTTYQGFVSGDWDKDAEGLRYFH